MLKRILIIEDEEKIIEICRDYLHAAGFETITAADGPTGLAAARQQAPALIILDLMLPGMDGLDICQQLRSESKIPIIILTARHKESDKLLGLEMGADDYITKPFSPREVVARVRTVLRRAGVDPDEERIHTGEMTLDRDRYRALLPSGEITLTPTEFDLLATLASQPGRVFSRTQLLNVIRGVAFESYERAIDSHIRNLRRKIEPSEAEPRHIITVHGYGYKYVE
jgi:two-component system, OmpR family, alkaline phosphatase synthesis response regulator PhoP